MKKVFFFTDVNKISDVFDNLDLSGFSGKKVPIKIHMGELKNKHFTRPDLAKKIVTELKKVGAQPFLHDTTVAYDSERKSINGYKKVAEIHGFAKRKIGCDVEIDDKGINIEVEGRNYEVAGKLYNSTHIFGLTHVKGHVATGMGGTIKNFGMGGVTKETKIKMHHGSRPSFKKEKCTYCGKCAEVCPFDAISIKDDSLEQNMNSCFGCGVCVDACTNKAMDHQDVDFQFALVCAAKACLADKNVVYLNELKRISKSCDCDPNADPIICPDIGYLISDDPVAIDKASLDLINAVKKDIFEKTNKISPYKQIKFGEDIGLGSSDYTLIELI